MCFAFIRQSREWTLSSRSPPPTPRRTHECRYVYCVSQEKRTHTTCTSHPDFWCFASGGPLPGRRLLASGGGGGAWWCLASGGASLPRMVVVPGGSCPRVVVVPGLRWWWCLASGSGRAFASGGGGDSPRVVVPLLRGGGALPSGGALPWDGALSRVHTQDEFRRRGEGGGDCGRTAQPPRLEFCFHSRLHPTFFCRRGEGDP